ncbi:MAG TPA: diacylglycerol kinase family protein [Burkholderiales bacterium]|nr:diacylglycerol kinase family protein [Burkholderiales bacterium]
MGIPESDPGANRAVWTFGATCVRPARSVAVAVGAQAERIDMSRAWFAVLNPVSGGGRGLRHRARIESRLREAGVECELVVSEHAGHAIELAEAAANQGFHRFLAIGGDGTLNELLNGAMRSGKLDTGEATLGLIPVGRGNDWARTHRIPHDYRAAAGLVARGRWVAHDAGLVQHGESQPRHFLNVAGTGFDAHVVQLTREARFGAYSYLAALPMGFASYRAQTLEVISPDETVSGEVFVAFAAICRYCGGGMLVAPDAHFDDGLLDITVVQNITRLELLRNIHRLFNGSIKSYAKVKTMRCRTVEIAGAVPVGCEADGELLASTPLRFSVTPHAVRVIVPQVE